ncbi:hypothetical protein, partial [Rhodovulum sulfidophilum]|uniref:hypothetical protein n=1 Tax=Rhodovulum sulfidophilum TaxID=35806 RepID=UPI001F3666E7
ILGQIQADRIDCHWVAPLSAVDDNCTMAHRDAGGAGAIHIIRLRVGCNRKPLFFIAKSIRMQLRQQ